MPFEIKKKWTLPSIIIIALAIVGALFLLGYPIQFKDSNYWDHRGIFFLIFITIFPRLTLLFSSVPFGGFLWWLGFFFAPRILVATLATYHFWQQNPLLVMISWFVALSGETGEKTVITKKYTERERVISQGDDIEVDYEVKS